MKVTSFVLLPWYPANFCSSTRGWSVTARGIYRELLDTQWEQGGLPADPLELQRLIGATPAEWRQWPTVEPKFPIGEDGRRWNGKLEELRQNSIQRSRTAAANANQRWRKGTNGHANA